MGFFDRLKEGLNKTREKFIDKIDEILHGSTKIDDELLDELEETLITSDVGMATTEKLIAGLRKGVRRAEINSPADVKNFLSNQIRDILTKEEGTVIEVNPPRVILMIGVNGAGKTTTIGKLSAYYKSQGKKVMMAAADTFRASWRFGLSGREQRLSNIPSVPIRQVWLSTPHARPSRRKWTCC